MEEKIKLRNFIEKNLNVFEDIDLSDSDNIFELGYVNSLFAMKMLHFIENEFNVTIENEEMSIENFSTVNNILQLIRTKIPVN